MSDNQIVVTCSDCGTRMRVPPGKKKGRCPKCKLWLELSPPVASSSDSVTITSRPADVVTETGSSTNASPNSSAPVLRRTAAAGILLGLLLTLLLSVSRYSLGVSFSLPIVVLLTIFPLMHIIVLLLQTPDSSADRGNATVSTSKRLLTFELSVLPLPLILFLVQFFGPTEGIIMRIMNPPERIEQARNELARVKAELDQEKERFESELNNPSIEKPLSKSVEEKSDDEVDEEDATPSDGIASIDPDLWQQADFLLVNPTHYAVGIRDVGLRDKPDFRILAKAESEQAIQAQKIAWDHKAPIIAVDPQFTRSVYHAHAPPESLKQDFEPQLMSLFEQRMMLPDQAVLVAYYDTVNQMPRIGHQFNNTPTQFDFCELVPRHAFKGESPFESEQIIRSERVKTDTEQRNLNDLSLRSSTDWLDYCIYQVLRTIQSAPKKKYQTGEPFVYVDTVQADVTNYENGLNALKDRDAEAQKELSGDYGVGSRRTALGLVDVFSRLIVDREEELGRSSVIAERRKELTLDVQELRAQIKQLRQLIDAENRLTSEIRSQLVRCGIKQVERSVRASIAIQTKVSGKNWIRPGSDVAAIDNLLPATHILITDIRHPEQSGRYQLSMRLVDVLTGEILWEDQGDRQEPSSSSSSSMAGRYLSLNGTWYTSKGSRGTIAEEEDGSLHATFTTADRAVTFDVTAHRKRDTITVESCTVKGRGGSRGNQSTVDAELRIVDERTLQFGCPNVNINSRSRLIIGDRVWSTFLKD